MAATIRAKRNRSSSSDSSSASDMSSCTAVAKPPDSLAGLGEAQSRLLVQSFVEMAHPGADPAEGGGHLGRVDHHAGECRQPACRGRDPPLQEIEHDGAAGRPGDSGVGQRSPELVVGQHELLNRFKVGGEAGQARPGRPPRPRRPYTPEASGSLPGPGPGGGGAPPAVSARSAATASSIRSRWASASTSRPMTRSTTSITISPMRAAASSTARWRARAISTSALPTMRSYSPYPACLGVGAHLLGRAVGRGDDLARLLARLFQHGSALVVSRLRVGARLVGRLEGRPDLLLALLHRLVDAVGAPTCRWRG